MDLCTGLPEDDFPDLLKSKSIPGQLYLPNCAKSFANGDVHTSDQWPTLTTWHAGLSCHTHLKRIQQGTVITIFDTGFQAAVENPTSTIRVSPREIYMQFLCYELRRGSTIPAGVGIEQVGDSHVCMYPTGDHCAISDISLGQSSFVIDALKEINPLWRLFALLKVKAFGYQWPSEFPPDSKLFPLRHWVKAVVLSGEADLAVAVACSTEHFTAGAIGWVDYFKTVLRVGRNFWLSCSYDHYRLNHTLLTAVKFALHFAELSDQTRKR
jgi:hypothetical protein